MIVSFGVHSLHLLLIWYTKIYIVSESFKNACLSQSHEEALESGEVTHQLEYAQDPHHSDRGVEFGI